MITLLCSPHSEWQPKALRTVWNDKQGKALSSEVCLSFWNLLRFIGGLWFVWSQMQNSKLYSVKGMFGLFSLTWRCLGYCGVVAELVSSSIPVPTTTSYSQQSQPWFIADSGAFTSCHSIPTPGVDSCQGQPAYFLVTCSMGLHWSPLTTLKRWPRC